MNEDDGYASVAFKDVDMIIYGIMKESIIRAINQSRKIDWVKFKQDAIEFLVLPESTIERAVKKLKDEFDTSVSLEKKGDFREKEVTS